MGSSLAEIREGGQLALGITRLGTAEWVFWMPDRLPNPTPIHRPGTAIAWLLGMLTSTSNSFGERGDRVREHTAEVVNRRIDAITDTAMTNVLRQGRGGIVKRLVELDTEWDIDRALMTNFALAAGTAFLVGFSRYVNSPWYASKRKGFLYLFGAQLGFLLLHGTVGWCPPASLFRRLGFRTQREIERERQQLLQALEGNAEISNN